MCRELLSLFPSGTSIRGISLFLAILIVMGCPVKPSGAAWDSSDPVARAFMGGGTATDLPWLALDGNPAGLAFVPAAWGNGPSFGLNANREALDAFRDYALRNNRQDWVEYFAAGNGWEQYREDHPDFAETILNHAGREHTVRSRVTVLDLVTTNFGLSVYGDLDKTYEQVTDAAGRPLPVFETFHRSAAGLKLGLGRNSGEVLGGEMAMGMALDIQLAQEYADQVSDFEAFDQTVRTEWRKFHYADPDLELEYSTRLGLQWRSHRPLIQAFRPSVGFVLVDAIGSHSGQERLSRIQMGLALNPVRRGVPSLALDYGSFETVPGNWEDGLTAGIAENLGALRLGLGVGDLGTRVAGSLNLGVMRLDYLFTSVKDADWVDVLGEKVHTIRVALGPFGKSGPVVPVPAGDGKGDSHE